MQRFMNTVSDLCAGFVKSFFAWSYILHSREIYFPEWYCSHDQHVPCADLGESGATRCRLCGALYHSDHSDSRHLEGSAGSAGSACSAQILARSWRGVAYVPHLRSLKLEPQHRGKDRERQKDPGLWDKCWTPVGFVLDPCAANKRLTLTKHLRFASMPNLGLRLARSLVSLNKIFWKMVGTFSWSLLNRKTR